MSLHLPLHSMRQIFFFEIMRKLKKQGVAIIFVSHKLEEVSAICDKVTVFRDGQLVGTELMENMTRDKMVRMMIGRESLLLNIRDALMRKIMKLL